MGENPSSNWKTQHEIDFELKGGFLLNLAFGWILKSAPKAYAFFNNLAIMPEEAQYQLVRKLAEQPFLVRYSSIV